MSDNTIIALPAGTIWTNDVHNATDISTAAGWTHGSIEIGSAVAVVDQFTLQSILANSTDSTQHYITKSIGGIGVPGVDDANNVYMSAYVAAGDVDWAYLRLTATNAGFAAVGGSQFFDLATPAVGSFTAAGAGAAVDAGIEAVDGGFKIWVVVDCGGNNINGFSYSGGAADSDEGIPYSASDTVTPQIYMGGLMFTDGPTAELPYIAT